MLHSSVTSHELISTMGIHMCVFYSVYTFYTICISFYTIHTFEQYLYISFIISLLIDFDEIYNIGLRERKTDLARSNVRSNLLHDTDNLNLYLGGRFFVGGKN